jgi:hypothetical protein
MLEQLNHHACWRHDTPQRLQQPHGSGTTPFRVCGRYGLHLSLTQVIDFDAVPPCTSVAVTLKNSCGVLGITDLSITHKSLKDSAGSR